MQTYARTYVWVLTFALSLAGCADPPTNNAPESQPQTAPDQRMCDVLEAPDGARIVCSDGQEVFIPSPARVDGQDGQDGSSGIDCSVQEVDDETVLVECDDGTRELISKASDGAPGAPGEPGEDAADFLISVTSEPAGEHCPDGGSSITQGHDLNHDGVLQEEELLGAQTRYICRRTSREVFTQIDLTGARSCASRDARVVCWGNAFSRPTPTPTDVVPLAGGVEQIATTFNDVCALFKDGSVGCAYDNLLPQGSSRSADEPMLKMVDALEDIVEISASIAQACALDLYGDVYCWGEGSARTPLKVAIPAARRIFTGPRNACAVTVSDEVYCWGANTHNQLTQGETDKQYPPTRIPLFDGDVIDIGLNSRAVYVLKSNGEIFVSGKSSRTVGWQETRARQLEGLSHANAQQMAVGSSHLCVLDHARDVYCKVEETSPSGEEISRLQKLGYLPTIKEISGGHNHLCFLSEEDMIYCAGHNRSGQLGNPGVPRTLNALDPLEMATPVIGL